MGCDFDYAAADDQGAQKKHTCSACARPILAGTRYVRHVRINEVGDRPETWKRCAACELIYRHLCERAGWTGVEPDPGLACGHSYEDVYREPPPAEIAALAFALPGEVSLSIDSE
jgi:hypothetical protein